MYKNMYNSKSKIRLILFSSSVTMLAKIQGGNKSKHEVRPREDKRMVKLNFFLKYHFFYFVLKKSMHSLFSAWSFLLVHVRFTTNEGPKTF